ncbi:MAG: energy-coupling factor transporter transmembrane component T family protein [Nitrososphaerales archaeon]
MFVRGNTLIHKMDPRVRLLMSIALFSVAIASHSFIELVTLVSIIVSVVATAKILRRFAKSMVFTLVISTVAFVIYFFESSPWHAIIFALRLFAVISSTSTFFLTSTPDELEHVMKWLRLPPDFVMVFVIAVRFIPVLMLDALQIMDAQRSRGLEFDKGNFVKRIRNTIPLLVPLIAVALNRSLDLAEAMDSRGYGAYSRPSSLYVLKLRNLDCMFLGLIASGIVLGFYVALSGLQ